MSVNSEMLGQMVESMMIVCGINGDFRKQWKIKSFLCKVLDAFLESFRTFLSLKSKMKCSSRKQK